MICYSYHAGMSIISLLLVLHESKVKPRTSVNNKDISYTIVYLSLKNDSMH